MVSKRTRNWVKTLTILLAFMCVFFCGMTYISFRPDTLKMFHWFKLFGILDYLEELEKFETNVRKKLQLDKP